MFPGEVSQERADYKTVPVKAPCKGSLCQSV